MSLVRGQRLAEPPPCLLLRLLLLQDAHMFESEAMTSGAGRTALLKRKKRKKAPGVQTVAYHHKRGASKEATCVGWTAKVIVRRGDE